MTSRTQSYRKTLDEINERGYRHDAAVAERLSLIAEILISILSKTI